MDQLEKFFLKLPRYHKNPGFFRVREFIEKNSLHTDAFTIITGGTNGKGSVGIMLEEILKRAGYSTGSFRSPHVYDFCERITFNGIPIEPGEFLKSARYALSFFEKNGHQPTFYDVQTASALLFFTRFNKPDFMLLEVGMGGLLDPVNGVRRDLSIITNIGHDHSHVLGSYPVEIAKRKAGIIAPDAPLFTAEKHPEALEVFRKACDKCGSDMTVTRAVSIESIDFSGTSFLYGGEPYTCGIPGVIQGENGGLAVETAVYLGKKFHIGRDAVKDGIASARLPWRMEVASKDPPVIFDGAHNKESWSNLRDTLLCFKWNKLALVLTIQKMKDPGDFPLSIGGRPVEVFLPAMEDRSFHRPEETARRINLENSTVRSEDNLENAAEKALKIAEDGGLAVFTGSFKAAYRVRKLLAGMLPGRAKV